MNYRHIHHAGNFADVFKHILLVALTEALHRKDTPCFLLDTHAGTGCYDLTSPPAQLTREYQSGIARLRKSTGSADLPALIQQYLACVGNDPGQYPGSPRILRALLRPRDRMVLCELHPADCQTLKAGFRHDTQVAVHHTDGWQSLKAFLPPPENRGLVLIDPPYEDAGEFQGVAQRLRTAVQRWPNGVYALWYPIKSALPVTALRRHLREQLTRPLLIAEIHAPARPGWTGLSGCGIAIVNPPWQIEQTCSATLPWLCRQLEAGTDFSLTP